MEIVKSQSAATVIHVFDKIFSARGVPDRLKTDNGTPFQSEDFKLFARFLGFVHQKITPYWPEANGLAERFMRSLGKTCRCAQITQKPWKQELYRFLRNYRATPHCTTGQAPATVLNGYPLKTRLPQHFRITDDSALRKKDSQEKLKMKTRAEGKRNSQHSKIKIGDKVIMKNVAKSGKLVPKFQPEPF